MPAKRNLADFSAKFDRNVVIVEKIRAALAELHKEGPEAWEYDGEFMRRANISTSDLAQFRDQFAEYFVTVREPGRGTKGNPRRVWFGSKAVAAKARK